ncbi:short chain dehydrogenase family protein, partial [Chlamydia psittaci 06-1683]
HMN